MGTPARPQPDQTTIEASTPLSPTFMVGKGRVEKAFYRTPPIDEYCNNPLIEALPDILTPSEAAKQLARTPHFREKLRTLPPHVRIHQISAHFSTYFEPFPIHLDLEERFSTMIRVGYQSRNPTNTTFWSQTRQRLNALTSPPGADSNVIAPSYVGTTANGFTIVGMSGMGKSTGVERVLNLYPQVIKHTSYKGHPFTHQQIVWLKMNCPDRGTLKSLCINFFLAVDSLINTKYASTFASRHLSAEQLLPHMARVASNHTLGVLGIDEIQDLGTAPSGGEKHMLDFFVHLANIIGVPIVLIGTFKAMGILANKFRQIRRGSGQGDLVWDRTQENSSDWKALLDALWKYQYVQHPVPLTPQLSHALYDESQGITDYALKIFVFSQRRAITTGVETLTPALFRAVAKDSLKMSQRILRALRNNDRTALAKIEDVYYPFEASSFLKEAVNTGTVIGAIASTPEVQAHKKESEKEKSGEGQTATAPETTAPPPTKINTATSATTTTGSDSVGPPMKIKTSPRSSRGTGDKKKGAGRPKPKLLPPGSVRKAIQAGAQKGLTAHAALQQAGLVRQRTACSPKRRPT